MPTSNASWGIDESPAVSLIIRPIVLRRAIPFCRQTHRRLPAIQGAMWSVGVYRAGELVGVAIVGRPARLLDDGARLAVLRVAVQEGVRNGCSMLYGACSRAARDMGASDLLTYTHLDEPGTTLRAAGWVDGGLTDGGAHDRVSRRRVTVDTARKRRWWAPWSERAKSLRAQLGLRAAVSA